MEYKWIFMMIQHNNPDSEQSLQIGTSIWKNEGLDVHIVKTTLNLFLTSYNI